MGVQSPSTFATLGMDGYTVGANRSPPSLIEYSALSKN